MHGKLNLVTTDLIANIDPKPPGFWKQDWELQVFKLQNTYKYVCRHIYSVASLELTLPALNNRLGFKRLSVNRRQHTQKDAKELDCSVKKT